MAKKKAATASPLPWKTSQLSRNVFEVRIPLRKTKDWSHTCLLASDHHWDNPKSRHDLILAHLNEIKEVQGTCLMPGDVLCLMQGRYDPRGSKHSVRPEHQVDNYLDAVISTAADFFAPYAQNIIAIGVGNHEAGVAKRLESHPTERLIGLLNAHTGASIYNGGFSGFCRFSFTEERPNRPDPIVDSVMLHYDHGYGGGGPVTKDMIQHHRRAAFIPDADIVCSGHVHEAWTAEYMRKRVTKNGRVYHDTQYHIKMPTYKEEYEDGFGGWHVERGGQPKPLGAWKLRFRWCGKEDRVVFDIQRAK